ncbi:MAG TPA: cation:proton antiporter [Candidatus Binatia bacterium]|nr:cation:proton antiporter [Candidatus Binatia bacterium]
MPASRAPLAGTQFAYNWQNPRPHPDSPQNVKPRFFRRAPGAVDARRRHRSNSAVCDEEIVVKLASIGGIGIAAQWLAWLIGVPSSYLLLVAAIVVGPITDWLDPDALLGNLFLPLLSLLVGFIVYEEGRRLSRATLRTFGPFLKRQVGIGVGGALVGTTIAGYLLGLTFPMAALFGVAVATAAPTVSMSMASGSELAALLDCESAVLLPLSVAAIALCVQGVLFGMSSFAQDMPVALINLVWVAGVLGLLGAALVVLVLKPGGMPPGLQRSMVATVVVAVFSVASWLQADSGFLAVGVLGFVSANQTAVPLPGDIRESSASTTLQAIVIVLLLSRLRAADIVQLGWTRLALLVIAAALIRPLSVLVATLHIESNWRERLCLGWLAPRGIVVAAVGAIAALRFDDKGLASASSLATLLALFVGVTMVLDGVASLFMPHERVRAVGAPPHGRRSPSLAG